MNKNIELGADNIFLFNSAINGEIQLPNVDIGSGKKVNFGFPFLKEFHFPLIMQKSYRFVPLKSPSIFRLGLLNIQHLNLSNDIVQKDLFNPIVLCGHGVRNGTENKWFFEDGQNVFEVLNQYNEVFSAGLGLEKINFIMACSNIDDKIKDVLLGTKSEDLLPNLDVCSDNVIFISNGYLTSTLSVINYSKENTVTRSYASVINDSNNADFVYLENGNLKKVFD